MLRRIKELFIHNTSSAPVVSEMAVAAFMDAITPPSDASPLAALVAQTRICAQQVAHRPGAYSPARLTHAVAAVARQLADMGDVTRAYVLDHWSQVGPGHVDPAAQHLWRAVNALALTAGLLDVVVPPQPDNGSADALASLKRTAAKCTERLCTDQGEPIASPAETARAIAQTLVALQGVFAPALAWVRQYVPERGRIVAEDAQRSLHEAIGRWASVSGLITHLPADPRPFSELTQDLLDDEPQPTGPAAENDGDGKDAQEEAKPPTPTKGRGRQRRATDQQPSS